MVKRTKTKKKWSKKPLTGIRFMRKVIAAILMCLVCIPLGAQPESTGGKIDRAQVQVKELESLLLAGAEQPQPQPLQWNRYVTNNFEILSLDDAQGKYLYDNIEFIKTWTLWRWGMKDVDFPADAKCKVIAVPSRDLYTKLFNRNSASWKTEVKDGKVYGTIWIVTEEQKWNTAIPTQLTEIVLANFEVVYGTKMPVWCHRGMTVLNSRFMDIRQTFNAQVNTKTLLEMTPEGYAQMNENQRADYDAQAAVFCLWVRQERNGKAFLDFLGGSMVNPQASLQIVGSTGYPDADQRIKTYQPKLATAPDYYLTW